MVRQHIHIATTTDGVRLGWARAGSGPPLVRAANWLTHLRHDLESPVWRHWIEFLAGHFDFVRYDERGCGMSDRVVEHMSPDAWLLDLECVVDAARIATPITLLGISQGSVAAIQYAIRHPQRVDRLVLYGGYTEGWARRDGADAARCRAVLEMVRAGWGSHNPVFRQAFTARFLPEGTHEQVDWFNQLCRESVAPDMAARLLEGRANVAIGELLEQVRVPTLVLHARGDEVVPFSEGRRLAAGIAGAEFVELDSVNHVLLAHEPAWGAFRDAVLQFTGVGRGRAAMPVLTPRERQVLALLREGLDNASIGRRLHLSEKTVRNHLSSVYRKLGVSSRTQAIVRAEAAGTA
jgi:pimeloyl-ACP methyl ester carboxylesterase/DNA-binding CsgD family transcriptional regulator